jgi:hypothetical protein
MASRVFLVVCTLVGVTWHPARFASAQVATGGTQQGQAEATLAWIAGPPSVATVSQSIDTFGQFGPWSAIADNQGNTSVRAEGGFTSQINISGPGDPLSWYVSSVAAVIGHSNLAAQASASASSRASLFFTVNDPLDVTLELAFWNAHFEPVGPEGSAVSSVELIGPGNQVVYSYTHSEFTEYFLVFATTISLGAGNYTMRTTSMASGTFAFGIPSELYSTTGRVTLTIPEPGTVELFAALGLIHRRKRDVRADNEAHRRCSV